MSGTIDRRALLAWLAGGAAIGLVGCETEPKPSATATLFNASEVQMAMKVLMGASGNLQSNVGRFDFENWRDVVPDVRAATAEVANAVAELRKALGYSDSS
jgi:hypothetical protein